MLVKKIANGDSLPWHAASEERWAAYVTAPTAGRAYDHFYPDGWRSHQRTAWQVITRYSVQYPQISTLVSIAHTIAAGLEKKWMNAVDRIWYLTRILSALK